MEANWPSWSEIPPDRIDTAHEFSTGLDDSPLAWRPNSREVAVAMAGFPLRSLYSDLERPDDSFNVSTSHLARASAHAWAAAGDVVALAAADGKIILADAKKVQQTRHPLHGHATRVTGMRWVGGGKDERLLSIGVDGTLRLWEDLRSAPEDALLVFDTQLAAAQWHPQKKVMAVLLAGDEVQVRDMERDAPIWSRPMPAPRETRTPFAGGRVLWSPDGRSVAAVCPGRDLAVWDLETGAPRRFSSEPPIADAEWMTDSRRMLIRTGPGWEALNLADGSRQAFPLGDGARWAGSLGDERVAAILEKEKRFFLRTGALGRGSGAAELEVELPDDLDPAVFSLSPRRDLLAMAGPNGSVLWVDVATGRIARPALAHSGAVTALGWHPDGSRLVSAGEDRTARIFNVPQIAQNWLVSQGMQGIVSAGWSADGSHLSIASLVRAGRLPADPPPAPPQPLAAAFARIALTPRDETGWDALVDAPKAGPWSAVAERGTSGDAAFGLFFRWRVTLSNLRRPSLRTRGPVRRRRGARSSLPAALQGAVLPIRVIGRSDAGKRRALRP